MAMINCPECGSRISDQAPSCPHCGIVFKEKSIPETNSKNTEKFFTHLWRNYTLFGFFMTIFGGIGSAYLVAKYLQNNHTEFLMENFKIVVPALLSWVIFSMLFALWNYKRLNK